MHEVVDGGALLEKLGMCDDGEFDLDTSLHKFGGDLTANFADDVISHLGKAGASNQSNVSSSGDRDPQVASSTITGTNVLPSCACEAPR